MNDDSIAENEGGPVARLFDWLEAKGSLGKPMFAFLMGLLLTRAFAPINLFPVLFIVIPVMIVMVDRARSPREAFLGGWWLGFGFFSLGLNWIGYSFTQQDQVPAALAPFAVLMLAAGIALYFGVAFWVSHRLWCKGWMRVLLFASVWTIFEVARGTWFTGLPWHIIGAAWADWLPVAQSVVWVTVYGLGFLTVLCAGSLVGLIEGGGPRRLVGPAVGLIVMGGIALAGYVRLESQDTRYHLGVTLRLVQANIPQHEKWLPHLIDDHFDEYLRLSRGGDANGKADGIRLLIWPETAVQRETFDRDGSLARWRMAKLLNYGSFALTGAPRYSRTPDGVKFYNSMIAINANAELYQRYDKMHLVPFGEYMPFQSVFDAIGLGQLVGGEAFSAGDVRETVLLPGVPSFSPLICYEIIFPGEAIDPANRPEWMLNITNDGWFGITEGPYQHLALARLRAIEEALPLVRSAGTGISAVIDANGRTVSSLGLGRRGTVESPLPVAAPAPFLPTATRVLIVLGLAALVVLFRLGRLLRARVRIG